MKTQCAGMTGSIERTNALFILSIKPFNVVTMWPQFSINLKNQQSKLSNASAIVVKISTYACNLGIHNKWKIYICRTCILQIQACSGTVRLYYK